MMKIIFTDRFNRKFLDVPNKLTNKIAYDQLGKHIFNRDNLPSSIWLDGDIFWRNTKLTYQCTIGPAMTGMHGYIDYICDNVRMSKMEWLISTSNQL